MKAQIHDGVRRVSRSSVRGFCARNSQREGRSLPRLGRDHLFQWDVGISVGFSTGTTGSLRNPETRRTPSYVRYSITKPRIHTYIVHTLDTQSLNLAPIIVSYKYSMYYLLAIFLYRPMTPGTAGSSQSTSSS